MKVKELINLQLMIFSMIIIGLVLKKVGVIGKTGQKNITDLVVDLILPCNIIKSFMVEFSMDIAKNFAGILLISILIQVASVILGKVLFVRTSEGRQK